MDPIPAGHALALWSALHILLLLGLSLLVVRQRRRHGVAMGDGGVPAPFAPSATPRNTSRWAWSASPP